MSKLRMAKCALQSGPALVQQSAGNADVADQARNVRDLDVLTDAHLRTLFHYSRQHFSTLKAAGRFARFAFREQLSSRTRYSGALVRAYLDNEGPARTFGGSRPRRVPVHVEQSADSGVLSKPENKANAR